MKQKVRHLRSTKGSEFPSTKQVKVPSLRTDQACSRAMVFLERHERRAFIRAMRELKPQVIHWLRYIQQTQGKDSADAQKIIKFWENMIARYRQYRTVERYYDGPPKFDPDVNGEKYG